MTFSVKTQALTAYAGVLSEGGHSIDLSRAFGTTAFNYVESYVPVPHDDGDLYDEVCGRVGAATPGERAGALELALEGLYLARRISKEADGSRTVYG